ncbi:MULTISPECIES: lytic polysaccharide monooxygenase [Actinomadura]|uniref:Chitin-binding protein n=1 Tax=Actinomadura litoris TaxID=2678616 RepID=A0A7K1L3W1_9ACTN|nr:MULTISPECIES: lytic polysaccharide monooxygenase [Actinomadura]MBT2210062.1 lytic polysaccharide monooxygenase [Actinomadura sp. NEAU-AAG7]MUN39114.1 chitin-binding protein [Actinomadura litoris]
MPRKSSLAVAAAVTVGLPLALAVPAWSHGYTTSPASRSYLCGQHKVNNCGQVQWDPDGVEGPKGFPKSGPRDGTICAGADSRWSPLDDQRGGTGWPATKVTSGSAFSISWRFTAAHSTSSFRYFLTKDGWNSTQPLTRAALDPTPFIQQNMGGRQPSNPTVHNGTLPQRTGRHVLLAVWDIADTGNAFYQCSDLDFG